ncbi:peptidylprolyl isomerase [Sandaracinobacteroides hominis]|uniref:peptidylprolyl isomerase n=1 Tax=Sandaracinobacteroides hominis TaxID=2780086 RepID=UPI0018F5519B|nr:peptidylprolyl isomerase [Sandaracinobacteroides hominis]
MKQQFAAAALALLLAAAGPAPSPQAILASSPAAAWRAVAPENLLLLEFAGGRQVAIELAPHFAPGHVANIRKLVADGWFPRHAAIVRVQENYVVQWGDPTEKAPLPAGVVKSPPDGYEQPGQPTGFTALPYADAYNARIGHADGWPVATDGTAHWLPHCPTMLGVGRNMPPDTGSGAELYVVIGHGPRHLDRNIALVGRLLSGMESLSSLPRGTEALGMYKTEAERIPLQRAILASTLPPAERPAYQVMRSDTPSFAAWVDARANRRDDFFLRPAGGADICNLMPPTRQTAQAK